MNKPETVIRLHLARDLIFFVKTKYVNIKKSRQVFFKGNIHLILYFLFFHNSFKPKRCVHILILCFQINVLHDLNSPPRFHEKNLKAQTDITGNGSQRNEEQFARMTLYFSREIEWL